MNALPVHGRMSSSLGFSPRFYVLVGSVLILLFNVTAVVAADKDDEPDAPEMTKQQVEELIATFMRNKNRDNAGIVVDRTLEFVDQEIEKGQYDDSQQLIARIYRIAQAIGRLDEIKDVRNDIKRLQARDRKRKLLEGQFQAAPEDIKAREALITFYMVTGEDIELCKTLFNGDVSPALRAVVEAACKQPVPQDERLKLAEWYMMNSSDNDVPGLEKALEHVEAFLAAHGEKDAARMEASALQKRIEKRISRAGITASIAKYKWAITFSSGSKRVYQFKDGGRILWLDPDARDGSNVVAEGDWSKKRGYYIIKFDGYSRFEVAHLRGNKLYIKHGLNERAVRAVVYKTARHMIRNKAVGIRMTGP